MVLWLLEMLIGWHFVKFSRMPLIGPWLRTVTGFASLSPDAGNFPSPVVIIVGQILS
jgi:hypothetical protein